LRLLALLGLLVLVLLGLALARLAQRLLLLLARGFALAVVLGPLV
jgi:hypothetical protein